MAHMDYMTGGKNRFAKFANAEKRHHAEVRAGAGKRQSERQRKNRRDEYNDAQNREMHFDQPFFLMII